MQRPSVKLDPSAQQVLLAEERGKERVLPHALKPGDPEDLAAVEREARTPQLRAGRQVAGGQDRRFPGAVHGRPLRRKGVLDGAADDHLDHLGIADIRHPRGVDGLAVPKDRHRVAEGAHLRHAVRDEQDRDPARPGLGDDPAEPVDILAGERRGGLVQQED